MIVVAGCGYVGSKLAADLAAAGEEVIGLSRSGGEGGAGYRELACDLTDRESVRGMAVVLGGHDDLRVVHCASSGRGGALAYRAVYVEGLKHLVDCLKPARVVFTSSTSVYPQEDGSEVDESSFAEPDRETGALLREAEGIALGEGGIVARLAGIYGPGRSFILKRFLEGGSAIDGDPSNAGAPGRIINQIHRDDAASALAFMLGGRAEPGEVYNVADASPMTQHELFEALAAKFDRPMPPVKAPDLNRKRGWTDKRVSSAKLRAAGWNPQFPDYRLALESDPELVPSILRQVGEA
jgi:nucleoside-diphosphate-sugar epimerase